MIFRSDWDKQKGASVSEHLFVFVRFCHFSGISLNPPSQGGGLRYVLEILPPFGRLDDNRGRDIYACHPEQREGSENINVYVFRFFTMLCYVQNDKLIRGIYFEASSLQASFAFRSG